MCIMTWFRMTMIVIWVYYDEAKAKYDDVIYDLVYGHNYENVISDMDDGDVVCDDNDILDLDKVNLDGVNVGGGTISRLIRVIWFC